MNLIRYGLSETSARQSHGHSSSSFNSGGFARDTYGSPVAPAASSYSVAAPAASSYSAAAPAASYGVQSAPATGYGVPSSGYGAPSSGYGAPSAGYGAPSAGYGAPSTGYGAPSTGYGAPAPVVEEVEETTDGGGGLASLILPLAALTLLGGTGAVLLGSVLIPALAGRKKREAFSDDPVARREADELELLERFWTHQPHAKEQADKMLAQYIDCSGVFDGDRHHQCLEKLACLSANGQELKDYGLEGKVLSVVMGKMLSNKYLNPTLREKLLAAAEPGRTCSKFDCPNTDHKTSKFVQIPYAASREDGDGVRYQGFNGPRPNFPEFPTF